MSHASWIPFISFCHCRVESKNGTILARVKYWEIIAENLSKAGWSWGCVSGMDSNGQTMFTVDAHRDEKRFVVRDWRPFWRSPNV